MTDPQQELERILGEVRFQLEGIRLEVPTLEGSRPPPADPFAIQQLWPIDAPPPVRREPEARAVPAAEDVNKPQTAPSPKDPDPAQAPAPSPTARLAPARLALPAAAALLTAGIGIWWSLRPARERTVLPLPSFDAIAARGAREWIVAKRRDILLYDAAQKPRLLGSLSKPLISLSWAEGALYGTAGDNSLSRWERLDAPPKTFSLDHAPAAIYVRPPNVWTLDRGGTLRQFLLTQSMTSVFLQPLDRVETGLVGDFSLAEDGTLIVLERASGKLLALSRTKSSYAVTARGASYGTEARLLSSGARLWIAQALDGKTTVLAAPPPPR